MQGLVTDLVPGHGCGRDEVVRTRLSGLLEGIGSLPSPHASAGAVDPPAAPELPADLGVGRLLDVFCPKDVVVMREPWARDFAAPSHHLVVAPRGAVVVGSCGLRPDERSSAVRAALARARGLRSWLSGTGWASTPVFSAVCIVPATSALAANAVAATALVARAPDLGGPGPGWAGEGPPVIMGRLWVGSAGRLPAWLASGSALRPEERDALRSHLAGSLPGTSP
jgi:hypothetical protein